MQSEINIRDLACSIDIKQPLYCCRLNCYSMGRSRGVHHVKSYHVLVIIWEGACVLVSIYI